MLTLILNAPIDQIGGGGAVTGHPPPGQEGDRKEGIDQPREIADPGQATAPLGATIGAYAATLLPIATGYLIAHYLTLLIQGLLWVPGLLANPLSTVAPMLDWMPISAVWYLSVGAIVLGHVVAVVLAHRHALREAASRPVLAGLPLVLLMVGYTVLSLWIIAAPITLEPGTPPAALIPR